MSVADFKAMQANSGGAGGRVSRGRQRSEGMNQTETDYAGLLYGRLVAGEILWFKFEAIKLRLADTTFYEPDFFVMLASGQLEVHEVKGHWEEDARVKIKVAASMYPFRFIAVTKQNKSHGGGFRVEAFE